MWRGRYTVVRPLGHGILNFFVQSLIRGVGVRLSPGEMTLAASLVGQDPTLGPHKQRLSLAVLARHFNTTTS